MVRQSRFLLPIMHNSSSSAVLTDNCAVPGNVLDVELGVTQQCVGITRTGTPF